MCANLLRTEKPGRFAIRSVSALQRKNSTLWVMPAAAKKEVRGNCIFHSVEIRGCRVRVVIDRILERGYDLRYWNLVIRIQVVIDRILERGYDVGATGGRPVFTQSRLFQGRHRGLPLRI
ncbi:MAG: hypothetical protein D3916_16895 [Candidatus Electrothrix sp. MAN1_4]|nr:hypothetical protein [Candidatus Electrothrix sp. MAN1_4]